MKINWSRKYSYILLGVLFLIGLMTILGFYRFIYPIQNNVEHLRAELESQEELIENTDMSKQALDGDNINSMELQRRLPIKKQINQFILAIEGIELKTGNTILLVNNSDDTLASIENSEDNLEVETLSYQIDVSSVNYDSMNQFIYELNNMDRIVEISQIEFSRTDDAGIDLSIGLTAFYNPSLTLLEIESPTFE